MKVDQPFRYDDYLSQVNALPLLFNPLVDILGRLEALGVETAGQGCMVGIKGDWGSGKTSVLHAIEGYFGKGLAWPTVFFEAWKYQNDEQPILPLIGRLHQLATGPVKGGLAKVATSIGVASLATADALLQMVTKKYIGKEIGVAQIEKAFQLAGQTSFDVCSKFEKTFGQLRQLAPKVIDQYNAQPEGPWREFAVWKQGAFPAPPNLERQLVILVDDLDRLLPDRAVALLEAIRFFLLLPRTIVVFGVNDQLMAKAIETRYCEPETKAPYFSGLEFMEKLFQWSYELPLLKFQPHMEALHFGDIKKRCRGNLPAQVATLVSVLDPLTHRKWVRIANRWETYIAGAATEDTRSLLSSLWLAIFHECFPETEAFLRSFPIVRDDFMNQAVRPDEQNERIVKTVKDLVQAQPKKAGAFHFSDVNYTRLISAWQKILEES